MTVRNGNDKWREKALFVAGLVGLFAYLGVSTYTGRFQIEWLLAFLTMMGVSITQGLR